MWRPARVERVSAAIVAPVFPAIKVQVAEFVDYRSKKVETVLLRLGL
jgi:hypothetical protein